MNLSLSDLCRNGTSSTPAVPGVSADALVVSQFTLLASTRKGNRPSFNDAARPAEAIPLYEHFLVRLHSLVDRPIATGTFGAMMEVALTNDGPVTLILDSKRRE